jgi:hypothetical protein
MSVKAAALSLYELAAPEREAVLRALSPEERARLTPFLEQLNGLGIPAGTVSRVQPTVPSTARTDSDLPDSHRRCAGLSSETVLQVTKHQSAQTVGALLSVRTWPWAQEVLEGLPETRKREVREFVQAGPSVAPAVQAMLIEALLAAVMKANAQPRARVGLLRKLAPWTR